MTDPDEQTSAVSDAAVATDARVLGGAALGQPAASTPNASAPVMVIDRPRPGEIVYISELPAVPAFTCFAHIVGARPDPSATAAYTWTMTIEDKTARNLRCVAVEEARELVGGQWTPPFPEVRGGEVTITASATVDGTPVSAKVVMSILGKNPDKEVVKNFCLIEGGEHDGPDLILIAQHETGIQQFDPGTFIPLYNRSGSSAVGLMQILDPPASCEARWNWQQNIREGLKLLKAKRLDALTALSKFRDESGKYRNDKNWPNEQVLRYETLQRYAGGTYWDRDDQNKILIRNPGRRQGENWIPSNFIHELHLPE